jgi:hypothetical protein
MREVALYLRVVAPVTVYSVGLLQTPLLFLETRTLYPDIGEPPVLDGAVHDTDTLLSAGLTDTVPGAPGIDRGSVDTAVAVAGQVASEFASL